MDHVRDRMPNTLATQDDADFANKLFLKISEYPGDYTEIGTLCHEIYQEMGPDQLEKYENQYNTKGLEYLKENDILIIHKSNHFRRFEWKTIDGKYTVTVEPNLGFSVAGGVRNLGIRITCITPREKKVFYSHINDGLDWHMNVFEDICKCQFPSYIIGLE
jgi:hypothetical protein